MTLNYVTFYLAYTPESMNDNLDNIGRIQQKLIPTSMDSLVIDILYIKDKIDALSALIEEIGKAVCVNSAALKEIVDVLADDIPFIVRNDSEHNSRVDEITVQDETYPKVTKDDGY